MTKYSYLIEPVNNGANITVTRNVDQAEKQFYIASVKNLISLAEFMDSITDDLAESYFPKPRKK